MQRVSLKGILEPRLSTRISGRKSDTHDHAGDVLDARKDVRNVVKRSLFVLAVRRVVLKSAHMR